MRRQAGKHVGSEHSLCQQCEHQLALPSKINPDGLLPHRWPGVGQQHEDNGGLPEVDSFCLTPTAFMSSVLGPTHLAPKCMTVRRWANVLTGRFLQQGSYRNSGPSFLQAHVVTGRPFQLSRACPVRRPFTRETLACALKPRTEKRLARLAHHLSR